MSVRSALTRLAIATAAGALATATAVTPAVAGDDWSGEELGGNGLGGDGGTVVSDQYDPRHDSAGHHGGHKPHLYKGVVTARTLLLRSAPNRGSRVIRTAHRGEIVKIYCKTVGQNVNGNPLWYLLTDGTWAWGAARYIDNIGPAPRWC
ncbi:SH3 domain-containing protein [Streptomyces sp. NPDC006997]|uniref:SH3 domain-containing protein n=1 Tax=Streptomyces sp. NPDC006997 TaxID=3155356 RepID=UPI0033CF94F8